MATLQFLPVCWLFALQSLKRQVFRVDKIILALSNRVSGGTAPAEQRNKLLGVRGLFAQRSTQHSASSGEFRHDSQHSSIRRSVLFRCSIKQSCTSAPKTASGWSVTRAPDTPLPRAESSSKFEVLLFFYICTSTCTCRYIYRVSNLFPALQNLTTLSERNRKSVAGMQRVCLQCRAGVSVLGFLRLNCAQRLMLAWIYERLVLVTAI